MSYHVHLTRKASSWADAHDPAAISLAEWKAYVASDRDMGPDYFLNPTYRTDAPTDWDLLGASVWLAYTHNGRRGYYARFIHQEDRITVADPDEEILGKMLAVAQALHARVQGDDGAYFDEDAAPATDSLAGWRIGAGSAFRDFQTFASSLAAQPLLTALVQAGIATHTAFDDGQLAFDPSFANNQLTSKFVVKIQLADFERAGQLLAELNQHALSQANPNHYLFSFADEELFDLLLKPDEWSAFDVALASQLLRQRGRDISPDTLRLLRQHRVAALAQPQPEAARDHDLWIKGGYLSALLGGFFGVLIGYQLYFQRQQLPDGRRVPAYTATDRVHGLRILVLGTIMLVLTIGLRLILLLRES